jgi:hypothetical protein
MGGRLSLGPEKLIEWEGAAMETTKGRMEDLGRLASEGSKGIRSG